MLSIFRLSKAGGVRIPAAVCNRRATPERRKGGATRRAEALWGVWLRCSLLTGRCGHARRSRLAIQLKPLPRGVAGYFNRLLMKPVALIIDDEVQIRRLLRVALEGEKYQVHEAENGQQGLIEIANYKPAIVLLDLGLPDLEGLEVLKRLREWSEAPVIVLTVRDDVHEKVAALDAGADDYVTKPFSTPELLARLRAAQRKTRPEEEISVFKNGDLVVDLTARVVTRAGREIKLSATEYALLRLFVRHPGRVLTHRYILREIWGPKSEEHRQYLRVYVTHLRQKIESDPAKPSLIKTAPGIGYRFTG